MAEENGYTPDPSGDIAKDSSMHEPDQFGLGGSMTNEMYEQPLSTSYYNLSDGGNFIHLSVSYIYNNSNSLYI